MTDPRWLVFFSGAAPPHAETTLAELLQSAGIHIEAVRFGSVVGVARMPLADQRGEAAGGTRWGAPTTFFWPDRGAGRFGTEFRYVPHLEFGQPGEYLTGRLTDEALRVIEHFLLAPGTSK